MRLVIYGGGALEHLDRLGKLAYTFTHLWSGALRRAVLEPFDAALFGRLEPALQANLADQMMVVLSGFSETRVRPLEDWLLARLASNPAAGLADPSLPPGRDAAVPRRHGRRARAVRRHPGCRCRSDAGRARHGRRPVGARCHAVRSRLEGGRRRVRPPQEPGLAVDRLDLPDGTAGAAHARRLGQGAQVRRIRSRQARRRRSLWLLGRVGRCHRPAAGRRTQGAWALPPDAARAVGHAIAAVSAPPAAGRVAAQRGGEAGRTACACPSAGGRIRRSRHGLAGAAGALCGGLAAGRSASRRPMPARPSSSVRRRTAGARRWRRSWRWAALRRMPRAARRPRSRTG